MRLIKLADLDLKYFLGPYTKLDLPLFGPALWSSIRNLSSHLAEFVDPLVDECTYRLEKEFSITQGLFLSNWSK